MRLCCCVLQLFSMNVAFSGCLLFQLAVLLDGRQLFLLSLPFIESLLKTKGIMVCNMQQLPRERDLCKDSFRHRQTDSGTRGGEGGDTLQLCEGQITGCREGKIERNSSRENEREIVVSHPLINTHKTSMPRKNRTRESSRVREGSSL